MRFLDPIHKTSTKAQTLLEVLIAAGLILIIILAEVAVYITAIRAWRQSQYRSYAQNEVASSLYHIVKTVRQAYSLTHTNATDIFVIKDDGGDNLTSNDKNQRYWLDGTQLKYDPDTAVSGDIMVLASGVDSLAFDFSYRTLLITLQCSAFDETFQSLTKVSMRCKTLN
ncbi:MAG: hypothetical protein V1893_02515 [Candidatus Omnitrophota bacterium]